MKSAMVLSPYELQAMDSGQVIIGVDEVGRGCLAGPVYAGAVALGHDLRAIGEILKRGLQDSKVVTPPGRERVYNSILEHGSAWAWAASSAATINGKGIVRATFEAMESSILSVIKTLKTDLSHVLILVDGFPIKGCRALDGLSQKAVVDGDAHIPSIAAASIVAKVARDREMIRLSSEFPVYRWDKNKGYGTKEHRDAIRSNGTCSHHRDLFVRKVIKAL